MKRLFMLAFACLLFTLAAPASAADLTPSFGYVAPGWVSVPPGPFDLSPVWAAFGFQETGLSYAYVGGPVGSSPYWERFDPLGSSYQAFFGAYVIDHWKYASDWVNPDGSAKAMTVADVQNSANELIALGNVDQFAWLSFYSAPYGGPTGSSYVPGSLVILPAGDGWFLLTFLVQTTSDLGAPVQPAPWVPPFSTFASDVPPFEPVTAVATVLVKYDVAHANFLARYGSGAEYVVDGHSRTTPLPTAVQIGQMMAATTFH